MFKGVRLLLVSLVALASFLVYDVKQASAVIDPITVTVASAALISSVIVGGSYYYARRYQRENGGARNPAGTVVSPLGTIGRDATITYVALGAATVNNITRNVTARLSFADLRAGVISNPSRYPALSAAFDRPISNVSADPNNSVSVGDYVLIDGLTYRITSANGTTVYTSGTFNASFVKTWNSAQQQYQITRTPAGTGGTTKYHYWGVRENAPPGTRPATVPEFTQAVSNSSSPISAPANVYSDFYGEIDDFIRSNPNVMSYVDTDDSGNVDDAPPFVLPVPPTPAALDAAQAAAASAAAASVSAAAAQKAATTARALATTARARADATADPADIRAAEAAEVAADNAEAAAAKSAADAAALAAAKAEELAKEEQDTPSSVPGSPSRKTLDFSKFNQLKGALVATFPFSLVATLPDYYDQLLGDSSAPEFHLPLYGNDLVVSLSIFDPLATVFRWLVGLISTIGVIYYAFHFWRGVS